MIGPIIVMGCLFGLAIMLLSLAIYILRNPNLESVERTEQNHLDNMFEEDNGFEHDHIMDPMYSSLDANIFNDDD